MVLVVTRRFAPPRQDFGGTLRIVAEPGGAAALAALLSRRYPAFRLGERIGVVVSGGNTVAADFKLVSARAICCRANGSGNVPPER